MSDVKLGLIGASRIARKVVPLIREIPGLVLTGVASTNDDRAHAFAKDLVLPRVYSSYDDCLSDTDVDAVYISVLNATHASVVEQALRAGKHVLCEKPLVLTAQDARDLFALTEAQKLVLQEGLMYRFHPQILKMREIATAGHLGKIRSIKLGFSFDLYDLSAPTRPTRATTEAGGGALNDLGCYIVDFMNSILTDCGVPTVIDAHARRDGEIDLETHATLRFQDGTLVSLECALDRPSVNIWEVSGTNGSVAALRFDPQGPKPAPLYFVDQESNGTLIECDQGNQFKAEFVHFVDVVQGRATPVISGRDSIRNAEIMDLIRTATQWSAAALSYPLDDKCPKSAAHSKSADRCHGYLPWLWEG